MRSKKGTSKPFVEKQECNVTNGTIQSIGWYSLGGTVGCKREVIVQLSATLAYIVVQSNQKMHDLYATMHISQMVFPYAFWAV